MFNGGAATLANDGFLVSTGVAKVEGDLSQVLKLAFDLHGYNLERAGLEHHAAKFDDEALTTEDAEWEAELSKRLESKARVSSPTRMRTPCGDRLLNLNSAMPSRWCSS